MTRLHLHLPEWVAKAIQQGGLFNLPSTPRVKNPRLTKQQKTVRRGSKTFQQTFYIDPNKQQGRQGPAQGGLFGGTAPKPRKPSKKLTIRTKGPRQGSLFGGDTPPPKTRRPGQPLFAPLMTPPAKAKKPTPKPAPSLPRPTPTVPVPFTQALTPTEQTQLEQGKLHVGDTKSENGRTYRLNKNHRWEREEAGAPKPSGAAPETPSVLPPKKQRGRPEKTIAKLLRAQGLQERIMQPKDMHVVLKQDTYLDLVIEKINNRVYLTHYREPDASTGGDRVMDAEMVYHVTPEGKLFLVETATLNPFTGGEARGRDRSFATLFSRNLIQQGFDKVTPEPPGTPEASGAAPEAPEEPEEPHATLPPVKKRQEIKARLQEDATRHEALDYTQSFTDVQKTLPKFGFELLKKSTPTQRKLANQTAMHLAEQLEQQQRPPTKAEREELAKYTGDGGVTGDINAYYTPTILAGSMWRLLTRAGYQGGRVLEPSMGAGVFVETAPSNTSMTGVELSPTTSRVAKLLHPTTAVHGSMPFEEYNATSDDEPFDAIIANPPYGVRDRYAAMDKPETKQAERYFIERSLDRLKDGGVATFLTNGGPFEQGSARGWRAKLLARAEVLGVYQLPSSTFKDSNSGVPPIVTILRKRPSEVGGTLAKLVEKQGEDALEAAGIADEAFLDGHLTKQPENIFGMDTGETTFANYRKITGSLEDAAPRMAEAAFREEHGAPTTLEELQKQLVTAGVATPDEVNSAAASAANEQFPIPEGSIHPNGKWVMRGHRWHSLDETDPTIAEATTLSNDLEELLHTSRNDPEAAKDLQDTLRERVQSFLTQYGDPNKNAAVLEAAKHNNKLGHLLAAVSNGETTGILTKDLTPEGPTVKQDDPESIATHLHRTTGRITPEELARNWLKNSKEFATPEEAKAYLMQHYAIDEHGNYHPNDDFYQGNIKEQQESLRKAAKEARTAGNEELAGKLERQAKHFREVLPEKSIEEFSVTPRDAWVPPTAVEAFVAQVLDPREGARYNLTNRNGVQYLESTSGLPPLANVEEFKRYLNFSSSVAAVRTKGKDQEEIAAERKANIEDAMAREEAFATQFKNWASISDYRELIENTYNDKLNNYITPANDESPLDLPGWEGPPLHGYQNAAVRFSINAGSSIMALDVGLGKTFAGCALLAKAQGDGSMTKPAIVAPKSLMKNWRSNLSLTLPHKKILVIGETKRKDGTWRDDKEAEVAKKLVQAATGDWDAVLISRDWFSSIPVKEDNWERMVASDVENKRKEELMRTDTEEAYKGQARRKRGSTPREDEKKRAKARQKAAEKLFGHMVTPLYFEDIGFDGIIMDEAHAVKNLHSSPATFGQKPKFMGGGAESKRAQDFLFKSKLIREKTGDKNIHLLTATPTKNSPLEVFNMLKHTTNALEEAGVPTVDSFTRRYTEISTAIVPDASGELASVPAVTGFKNLRELRSIMNRFINRKTAQEVGLKIPERKDTQVPFPMSEAVKTEYDELARKAKKAAGDRQATGDKHLFSYFARMRELTLDPALYNPKFMSEPNPRFQKAASITKNALKENGKVVMFMDSGQATLTEGDAAAYDTMSKEGLLKSAKLLRVENPESLSTAQLRKALKKAVDAKTSNAYDRLTQELVKSGIPENQIAVVTAKTAKSSAERGKIEDAFNAGDIKVVIGSTGVIGEGFNLQKGTSDMIHLDTPWDPGTYWQRLGRAVRQGNPQEQVRNHVLVAQGSFDGLTYSTMTGKRGWMQELWDSDNDTASNEGNGADQYEEAISMLSSDPEKAKEFIAQKKREITAKAEKAKEVKGMQDLGKHGRIIKALRTAQTNLKRMQEQILEYQQKAKQEPNPEKAGEIQASMLRAQETAAMYQSRIDKLEPQILMSRRAVDTNPYIPAEWKALANTDRDYLVDKRGRPYVTGGALMMKQGYHDDPMPWHITSVNHARQKVFLRPVLPINRDDLTPHAYDIADLSSSTGHALEPSSDMIANALKVGVKENGGPSFLKYVSPERTAEHAELLQQTLRAEPPTSAYIRLPDGGVEFRRDAAWSGGIIPGEGERYLLNTPEDLAAFKQQFPEGVGPGKNYVAPFHMEFRTIKDPTDPYGQKSVYLPESKEDEYAIKALTIKAAHKLHARRTWHGLQISIENRKGSIRSGTNPDGTKWRTKMPHHYGYVRGTIGVDGDHLDVFLGPNQNADNIYIIHQRSPHSGRYDEDKVMLNFQNADAAKRAYNEAYDKPHQYFIGMTEMPIEEFIGLVENGKVKNRILLGKPRARAGRRELRNLIDAFRDSPHQLLTIKKEPLSTIRKES